MYWAIISQYRGAEGKGLETGGWVKSIVREWGSMGGDRGWKQG